MPKYLKLASGGYVRTKMVQAFTFSSEDLCWNTDDDKRVLDLLGVKRDERSWMPVFAIYVRLDECYSMKLLERFKTKEEAEAYLDKICRS